MAYSSNPLWPPTQPTGLHSQVGGLFHNLETQDDLLDFHEPAKVRPWTSKWRLSTAYNQSLRQAVHRHQKCRICGSLRLRPGTIFQTRLQKWLCKTAHSQTR